MYKLANKSNSSIMKHYVKNFLFSACCLGGCLNVFSQPVDTTPSKIKTFFTNIAAYDSKYTHEKVYLHLDNNGYFVDETIWFKAYVVRASTLKPTNLSQVLYVELLNPEGELIQRKILHVRQGQANGEFKLDKLMNSGYYELRAYTRPMLNWDPSYIYSRVIPVFDAPDKAGDFQKLNIYERPISKRVDRKRPDQEPLLGPMAIKAEKLYCSFYPEGGSLVKGLDSRIAFKLINTKGHSVDTLYNVCDAGGNVILSSRTLHDGMGVFTLPANAQGGFLTIGKGKQQLKYNFPQSLPEGCVMQAENTSEGLDLNVSATSTLSQSVVGLSITCRGAACYFNTLSLAGSPLKISIPRKDLHDGVHQVTLFTSEGKVLSERLFWCDPLQKPASLMILRNATTYKTFSPVMLEMELKDAVGHPKQGVFSVSVRDNEGELVRSGFGIRSEMLLASDLRGYIANPDYYFESPEKNRLQALNALLMVQGWRCYDWQEMAGVKPFKLVQPVEEGLLVDGTVLKGSGKKVGLPDIRLDLNIFLANMNIQGGAMTDSVGKFAFLPPTYYGEGIGRFSTTENGKPKASRVTLNRGFSPAPRSYEPAELVLNNPLSPGAWSKSAVDTFAWKDPDPGKILFLPEAQVKSRKKDDYTSGRYTYMGGENAPRKHASLYYNIEDEMDELLDQGEEVPMIWDWLRERNKDFDYTYSLNNEGHNVYDVTYKRRPVFILLDNRYQDQNRQMDNLDIFGDEIKSISLAEGLPVARRFVPIDVITKYVQGQNAAREPSVLFLYTQTGSDILKKKKGERLTRFHGYAVPGKFYSPDYRSVDLPNKEDFRRTLYWNPYVVTDKEGKASVYLYNNVRGGNKIRVTAEGLTLSGDWIDYDK